MDHGAEVDLQDVENLKDKRDCIAAKISALDQHVVSRPGTIHVLSLSGRLEAANFA